MKRLIAALFIFTVACTSQYPAQTPKATETPLVIPVLPKTTPVPTRTPIVISPTPTLIPVIEVNSYVVQSGEILTDIAEKFGLTVEYLAGLNSIADPNLIYPGQVLKLTGKIEVPKPTLINGKQIVLELSIQKVFVFQDGNLINSFVVSTGITKYPTRIGEYRIREKLFEDHMVGPDYDLPHVKWVMYFDEGRGFHAKYWNEIYGRPSSHGCVNMTEPDAKWLYDWASEGTDVLVIP